MEERTDKHGVKGCSLSAGRAMCWRLIWVENTAYSAKLVPKQTTKSNYPRHLLPAQWKMQHLRISWRNPCIWRLDFCQIIKSCSCFWMDHKSKKRFSLIDRLMTSEGGDTLILPVISKTGQSVAQNRKKKLYLGFFSKEETYFGIL